MVQQEPLIQATIGLQQETVHSILHFRPMTPWQQLPMLLQLPPPSSVSTPLQASLPSTAQSPQDKALSALTLPLAAILQLLAMAMRVQLWSFKQTPKCVNRSRFLQRIHAAGNNCS